MRMSFLTISCLTTAAFTVERVVSVFYPFKFQNQERSKILAVLIGICITSFGLYFPLIFIENVIEFDKSTKTFCRNTCNLPVDPKSFEPIWYQQLIGISEYLLNGISQVLILPLNISLTIKLSKEHRLKR